MNVAAIGRCWPLSVLVALAVATGCSDAASSGDGSGDPRTGDSGPPPADSMPPPPDPDSGPVDPLPGVRELVPEAPLDRVVFFGTTTEFRVQYRTADGRPVPNGTVTARLLDENNADRTAQGVDGTFVQATNARTGADGWATFRLQAGNLATRLQLEVAADGAAEVFWNVTVAREGTGSVRIKVNYDEQTGRYAFGDLQRVDVSLFEQQGQSCEALRASASELRGAYLAIAIEPFDPTSNEATVDDLDDGARFAVAAQVRGTHGGVVAFGCAEGVEVRGGEVTTVDIQALDLPLDLKGRFTVVNRFRMTDLLRNSGNDTAETVAQVLDVLRVIGGQPGERGEGVIRLFCQVANLDPGICDVVETLGAGLIERAIERFVPMEVLRVLNIIGDVLTIIEEMTVVGEFEFISSQPDESGLMVGNDNRWQKFRFIWRDGCPQPGMCEREFTIGDLDVERRPIAGAFTAELRGVELHIQPHSLNVKYGLILLGIAEQWVIPAILGEQGPVTIEDMLAAWLPCEEINNFFNDQTPGVCEEVLVQALSDVITDQIGRLDVDVDQFVLEGDCSPLDTDGDLRIDTLANGVWRGTMRFSDDNVVPFSGCFSGCRPEMECAEQCEIPAGMEEMD